MKEPYFFRFSVSSWTLIVMAAAVTAIAYVLASLGANAVIPARIGPFLALVLLLIGAAHLAVRVLARGADPTLLPLAVLLHGIGYVMITRLNDRLAGQQSAWSLVAIVAFAGTLLFVQRPGDLQRYRWTLFFVGAGLLVRTLTATFIATLLLFAYWGLFTWVPTFLAAPIAQGGAGMGVVKSTGWVVPMQLGALAGYLSFGFLADRFGRRPVFLLFVLSSAVIVPVYGAAARDATLLMVLGPLVGFFGHGYFSVFGAGIWYLLRLMKKPPSTDEMGLDGVPIRSAGITPAPAVIEGDAR